MKRIIASLFIIFNTLLLSAQSHMLFKGIPIDGPISSFVGKLEQKGYTMVKKYDDGYIMKGIFTGKDAYIYILNTPKTKTVWKVVASIVQDNPTWDSLKKTYLEYKQNFINKYGEPVDNFD